MSNQGQRFRRRAVRRGYKVDEVDEFLDRVEATLNGAPGASVTASEVHDVVFRVRFGGYDEWQVDLHLDRVERQLAELEERAAQPGRGAELRATELRPAEPRMAPQPPAMPMAPGGGGPLPSRPIQAPGPVPATPLAQRFDDVSSTTTFATGSFDRDPGFDPGRHGKPDMTTEIRMPDAGRFNGPPPGYGQPHAPQPPQPPQPAFGQPPAGYGPPQPPQGPPPGYAPQPQVPQGPPPGYGPPQPPQGPPAGFGGFNGPPAPPMGPPGMGGGGTPPTGEVQRVDQMRRTFQLRRFGSGYDPSQVDRLFDGVINALAGHGGSPISDSELDPGQFSLVPGGYYEGEVDAALREVRDIVRGR